MIMVERARPRPIGVKPGLIGPGPRTDSSGGARITSREHIRNPVEWTADQLWLASQTVGSLGHSIRGSRDIPLPAVRRINAADLKDVLRKGLEDFGAYRSDVIFICLIYPLVGLALAWLIFGHQLLPLLFRLPLGLRL